MHAYFLATELTELAKAEKGKKKSAIRVMFLTKYF